MVGLTNGEASNEDVEMNDINRPSRRYIVGSSELNYKRDHMEIQPLYSEPGVSKITKVKDVNS